jgi:hypothetical protein
VTTSGTIKDTRRGLKQGDNRQGDNSGLRSRLVGLQLEPGSIEMELRRAMAERENDEKGSGKPSRRAARAARRRGFRHHSTRPAIDTLHRPIA